MDVQCHGQTLNELLKVCDPLSFRLAGWLIRGAKHSGSIFKELLPPLGDLIFAEVMAAAHFRL